MNTIAVDQPKNIIPAAASIDARILLFSLKMMSPYPRVVKVTIEKSLNQFNK